MTLPARRPRTFDDVHDRLVAIETDVEVIRRSQQSMGSQVADMHAHLLTQGARPLSVPPMRGPEDTLHDFDPKLPRLRAELREAVKDPKVNLNERDAERIVEEAIEKIQARRELGTWRWVKSWPRVVLRTAIKYAPHWLSAGGAAELVHWLLTHR